MTFDVSRITQGRTMLRLRVSDNRRYLVCEDGTPFLWIGDTAWHMVDTLRREDVDRYLDHRAANGFTVIQAAIFMGQGDDAAQRRNPANAYGDRPFHGGDEPDPAGPRILPGGTPDAPTDYWDHLDYIVRATGERGLYLALLPCWGAYHIGGRFGSAGEIFDVYTARAYGHFIGSRYGREPHLIWVLGGDTGADEPRDRRRIYRRMAEGLVEGATGQAPSWDEAHPAWDQLLMTYHPGDGQSSSAWFHRDAWLDFHMIQTFQHRTRLIEIVCRDCQLLAPPKPTIMAGPAFEGYSPHSKVRTYPFQMRRQAYQSFWHGAAGFTYGCAMSAAGGAGPLFGFGPGWTRLLDLDGGQQVATVLRAFCSARAWWAWQPCPQAIVEGAAGEFGTCAVTSGDRSEALIYFPDRTPATLRLDCGTQEKQEVRVRATWFDPARGETQEAGVYTAYATEGCLEDVCDSFLPPRGWLDAVLILRSET
jgi:hypothetical protein